MEFLILGPIAVRNAAGEVVLGGNKPRAVLAVLLLHPNQPVSAERLALALWGEDAPGRAVKTVHVHVSRLRKALGDPDVVTTTPAGYSLRVRQGELDAERFEGLVEDARQAMADGLAENAAAILRTALAMWRGTALAELDGEPFAVAEIARLHEQRLAALELRVEADLAAGRHTELVGELQQLVVEHPVREELAAQHMLALYRCGRQTEALEAYARARRTLVDEMGIEPGPRLRERHEAILRQDPALRAEPATTELPAALDPASAQPLVGRDAELELLLARWDLARNGGGGGLVALAGPPGAGKTRLAAEFARATHRPGVTTLYASGDGPADSILVALRRVREARRPTLLVIDDADRAGAGVQSELGRLASTIAGAAVLVVVIAQDAGGLAHLSPTGVVELAALDARAVREIALRYAPGEADVPTEWLLEASGGVPGRVHEAAGQWARREAARHVGSVADRARTGRAELRSVEAELAGGIADLQESRTRLQPGGGDDGPVVCPFKGLATFDVGDARYFHGRERVVAELVARLVGSQLLAIVGPSGSGKSSVMRAGLLPALSTGVLPGSEQWSHVLLRPGDHPLRDLAAALADVDGDGRVVLAVDQFEETFTACDDEAERAEFIGELVSAATDARQRYVVVIALRADYYGRCAGYPALSALLAQSSVLVGAMRHDELRRAIEEPCRRAGLRIEDELVDALVADVEREPGGLPLLSSALLELWQQRDGRRLRYSAYAKTGGVQGAVGRLAEDAFAQLDETRQAVGRTVLMRLVGGGEGDTVERRRVALDELEIDREEDVARVVALLTDRRLLTVGAGTIELAHDALLREWPRLRGWVDDDRDGLRIRRGLGAAAREWDELRRDDGALYRGSRLAEAIAWRDDRHPSLNELERDFLDASDAARRQEQLTRRRRTRLVLGAAWTIVAAGVAVAVAAWFANRQHEITASRDIATQAATAVGFDPGLALALARSALDRHDTPQARDALRQAALEDRSVSVVQAHESEAYAVDSSPDGSMVASSGDDGRVRLWRAGDLGALRTLVKHRDRSESVAFSPDGSSVASASVDGSVAVTPVGGGAARTLYEFPGGLKERAFRIAAGAGVVAAGTSAGRVWVLPTAGGGRPFPLGRHPSDKAYVVVAIAPDGRTVFSADDQANAFLWDVSRRTSIRVPVKQPVYAVAFSRDGKRIASAGPSGRVRIWNASTGAAAGSLPVGDRLIYSVRFSADGRRIVTTGDDHVVQVLDVAAGRQLSRIPAANAIFSVFATAGRLVSADADGKLRTWTPLAVRTPPAPTRAIRTFPSFSPDGRQVVVGDHDPSGDVLVWDRANGQRRLRGAGDGSVVTAFLPGGRRVVSASLSGITRVTDVRTGVARELGFATFPKYAVAASRTGRIAVAGGPERNGAFPIVVMTAAGKTPQKLVGHTDSVVTLAFSRDGRRLASGSVDGMARIWDLATGEARTIKADARVVHWVSWDAGGHIATAGGDGTIRVWPVDGGDPVVLAGHGGPVNTATFNRRGDRIVSTGLDGTVRVWDAAGGDTLVLLTRHQGADGAGAAFSPDGRYVVSSGADGVRITRCEACDSFAAARRLADTRAPRALSASERERVGLD